MRLNDFDMDARDIYIGVCKIDYLMAQYHALDKIVGVWLTVLGDSARRRRPVRRFVCEP